MSKCVIFVEGQSEQIFVRELLLRRFVWDANQIAIRCLKLNAEALESVEYDFGKDDAAHLFQLIDAGGDNKVVSAIRARHVRLLDNGFGMIVGLRDMYSRAYRDLSSNRVSDELNKAFVESTQEIIENLDRANQIRIHFAIMEVETWMLALLDQWKGTLTSEQIAGILNPEIALETIFHPYVVMKEITTLMNNPYEKHKDQVNTIMSNISWEDYANLYNSNRCPSFNAFLNTLDEIFNS